MVTDRANWKVRLPVSLNAAGEVSDKLNKFIILAVFPEL